MRDGRKVMTMGLFQKREEDDREIIEGVEIIEDFDKPEEPADDAVETGLAGAVSDAPDARDEAASEGEAGPDSEEPSPGERAGAPAGKGDSEPGSSDGGNAGGIGGPRKRAILIACFVIVVIIAAIGGYFVGSGGFVEKGAPSSSLTDDQLDSVVASYSYNGGTVDVTARQAIESQYSLSTVQNDDGTYAAPSAEVVLAYVRTQILLDDAKSRGIEVSDDEMSEFAESQIGSSDYSQIASQYGVDEDQAKDIVRQSATINKLMQQVVPDASDATAPTEPTAPADGDENAASADYAAYIINLAGDEWDSSKGTWASTDGPYYSALGQESFTADSATYGQALTAYYVAYQQYANASSETSKAWSDYANGLYLKANVTVYGIVQ